MTIKCGSESSSWSVNVIKIYFYIVCSPIHSLHSVDVIKNITFYLIRNISFWNIFFVSRWSLFLYYYNLLTLKCIMETRVTKMLSYFKSWCATTLKPPSFKQYLLLSGFCPLCKEVLTPFLTPSTNTKTEPRISKCIFVYLNNIHFFSEAIIFYLTSIQYFHKGVVNSTGPEPKRISARN